MVLINVDDGGRHGVLFVRYRRGGMSVCDMFGFCFTCWILSCRVLQPLRDGSQNLLCQTLARIEAVKFKNPLHNALNAIRRFDLALVQNIKRIFRAVSSGSDIFELQVLRKKARGKTRWTLSYNPTPNTGFRIENLLPIYLVASSTLYESNFPWKYCIKWRAFIPSARSARVSVCQAAREGESRRNGKIKKQTAEKHHYRLFVPKYIYIYI